MTTAWRKAVRDSWRARRRTLLVVLAIALGVAATDAVLSAYAILTRELDRGYLATNPASATLWTDATDDALLQGLAHLPGVGEAEARRTLTARVRVGTAAWRNATLFVVKDFASVRVSTLTPEKGAWPPAPGEILIERDALQVARTQIGATLSVRTARGKELALRVAGTVHDVGQAQARMENQVYGYVSVDTLALLGEEPRLDQVKLLVADRRLDESHVRAVTAAAEKWMAEQGHPVRRTEIPKPGKHPHSDIMGLLLLTMSGFGAFVLLLSAIITVNLLSALLAAQVRQIAVMKAIGGTRAQIARIYFLQALVLGLAALAVALPLGIAGGRALCRYMAVFLNFDITSFAVPAWVYLLVAATSIVVPLLAAAYPVWKGTGRPVCEGLADQGVAAQAFGVHRLDRVAARLGGPARPLLVALRGSFRRRTRLALTLLTLGAAGLFFMSALNVRASMIRTLDRLFASKRFDLSVNLGDMVPSRAVERAVGRTARVRSAEGWIVSEGTLPASGVAVATGAPLHGAPMPRRGDTFTVIALPAGSRFMSLELEAGRDLRAGETDALVVNTALAAKRPEMRVGATVTFLLGPAETTWHVVGIARESFSPPTAYVARSFYDERHPGMVNSARLVLERTDTTSIDAVKALLEKNLEEEGVRPQSMSSRADSRFALDEHMRMIYVFLIVMSCILAGVGGLGLGTTMSLNVLERRREIGIMRAVGASPGAVVLILVTEGVLVAAGSWALAALAAWPVSKGVGDLLLHLMFRTRLDFAFQLSGLWLWLGVCLVLGSVASLWPAWAATRGPVHEALGYE